MIYGLLMMSGTGNRLTPNSYKQYIKINGIDIFLYSLNTFLSCNLIDEIVLVVDKDHLDYVQEIINKLKASKKIYITEGSDTRQKSVYNGLKYLKTLDKCSEVVIHDAARPLLSLSTLKESVEELKKADAVAVYIPSQDSLVFANGKDYSINYINRNEIMQIQTPQCFKFDIIFNVHEKAIKNSIFNSSDDLQLVKGLGVNVSLIKGSKLNFKVTDSTDLEILKKLLAK
ncbi:MAG: 2-C-methyl-D-erythritol 4-phosphate cytidylyltransferase [Erysipelotrichaceae bacterium]|jgi:2-C-methyl-D-erythritol 4-phosphate cytidylyltransferase|nr:2-C-methyl-D-erythritol 4-phosphate cytidylyltransferase [Erysipelotrichaceae bacterium]MCB9499941.1 2-C-methyl-D-erythritol 4-phosphate cytidylyltransferase [Erysipelotrichaceae bacterium]